MDKRFVKVKGKPGKLVANPNALDARRFVGQLLMFDPPKGTPFAMCFLPCEEVTMDDPHLRSACAVGDLELIDSCVAESVSAAQKAMAQRVESKPKPKVASPKPASEPAKEESK